MIETLTAAAKIKVFLAALSILLVGGSLYELQDEQSVNTPEEKDPYTLDIQNRAQLVENTVTGVIDAQGTEEAWKFKQTCEDATSYIRKENLEAEQEDTTLNAEQRELNKAYKEYLKEAAYVVSVCYTGGTPDLTKMNTAKIELY